MLAQQQQLQQTQQPNLSSSHQQHQLHQQLSMQMGQPNTNQNSQLNASLINLGQAHSQIEQTPQRNSQQPQSQQQFNASVQVKQELANPPQRRESRSAVVNVPLVTTQTQSPAKQTPQDKLKIIDMRLRQNIDDSERVKLHQLRKAVEAQMQNNIPKLKQPSVTVKSEKQPPTKGK